MPNIVANIDVRRPNKQRRVLTKSKVYNAITNKNVNIPRYRSRCQCCCRSGVRRTPERSCSPSACVPRECASRSDDYVLARPASLQTSRATRRNFVAATQRRMGIPVLRSHLLRPSRPRVGEPVAPLIATNSINPLGIGRRPRSLRVHGLI